VNKMQNIAIEKSRELSSMYWSNLSDKIIRFHLNEPEETISVFHRNGTNNRIIDVFKLSIEGINWESLLLSVFSVTDADTTVALDNMANFYCDIHREMRNWLQTSNKSGDIE